MSNQDQIILTPVRANTTQENSIVAGNTLTVFVPKATRSNSAEYGSVSYDDLQDFVEDYTYDKATIETKLDEHLAEAESYTDTEISKTAGKKYPLGSTTSTDEIFNDYEHNVADGTYSHAEGALTVARGVGAHAEGWSSSAGGCCSHAEGYNSVAGSSYPGTLYTSEHAEGRETRATGRYSHSEGWSTEAGNEASHAEGYLTEASGARSHAEGYQTTSSGSASHAEGYQTTSSGANSHAGGKSSVASHENSFVHGLNLKTSREQQTVVGQYNADVSDAMFIVGNGNNANRRNALVVKFDGTVYGGNNKQLATQEYVGTVAATKQDKIDSSHKLSADLVDDTSTTNKFVTASEKSQITTNANDIAGIEDLIPSQASDTNQLADKNFVNSSINSVAAYYITKNAQGDPFATHAELVGASVYYSGGEVRVPTRNDYAIVLADETKTDAVTSEDPTTRYSYQNGQWEFQYIVNKTALTAAQLAAINSGITSSLVGQISTNATNITNKTDKHTYLDFGYSQDYFNYYMTILTGEVKNEHGKVTIKSDAPLSQAGFTDYKSEILVDTGNIDFIVSSPDSNGGKVRINNNEVETQNNKVTSISNSSTDSQYPSAKCVYDELATKVSDVTLNNSSIVTGGVAAIPSTTLNTKNIDATPIQDSQGLVTSGGVYDYCQEVSYLTTAPSSANTSGRLKVVVLTSEPATKYDGYLYFITEA